MRITECIKTVAIVVALIAVLCAALAIRSYAIDEGRPAAPAAKLAAGGDIVENDDPGWIWSGMTTIKDPAFHGGSAAGGAADTYGGYAFTGTGVRIVGYAGPSITISGKKHSIGQAKISIDGQEIATTTMVREPADYAATIYKVDGLTSGKHVLKVSAVNGWVLMDYIVIDTSAAASPETHAVARAYYLSPKEAPRKVLETWPGTIRIGTLADLATYVSDHGNVWWFEPVGDGLFRIWPDGHPDLSLTVPPSQDPNPSVGLVAYTGSLDQKWKLLPSGGGYYRVLLGGDINKCLNVFGTDTGDGTKVLLWSWQDNGVNDQWLLTPVK